MGKPEVKRLLGRPTSRWEYNIKMDFKVTVWSVGGVRGMDCSGIGQEQVEGTCKYGKEFRVP